ncbi:MAG: GHKL domain-containing protein, partial [Sneathiella sp.]|nr:GHKL domain-containing protein [Sneathiella sp.]
ELRSTSLASAIDESLILLDQRIRGEEITIINTLAHTDISVMAGDVRLQQVFINLLSNAIDALDGLPIKTIHISAFFEDGDVLIDVKDTGPGIDEEQIVNVFDPFYSSKEVGKGMGLGLSITLALVHQFGGAITVCNDPEGGAIFTLRLKKAELVKEAAV